MDREGILENILEEYRTAVEENRVIQQVRGKIASGAATTYADAQDAAIETGKAVSGAIRNHLPDAVTEDRLARETAEVIVKKPMIEAGTDVSEIAKGVQESLNENADLGLDAIVPELNEDQIDGIISGICNAEDYRDRLESFMDGVENFYEGVVDDFVHDNAQFQYEAGLSPVIERIPVGKCCKWCSNLAGKYPYEKVRDTGNDVFRRHKNCHCQILYNPGDGSKKRQDVHSKKWTEEADFDRMKKTGLIPLDLQQFGGKGDYRAALYGHEWKEASLKATVKKFVPGATKSENRKKGKVFYDNPNGRYQIVYDRKGNYFRILDKEAPKRKPYVGLNGELMLNKTVGGRTVGIDDDEYERLTHFRNSDKAGRR